MNEIQDIQNLYNEVRDIIASARQNAVRSVDFYRIYPIANTLYSQLNWSQYKLLIAIPDEYKREYYQLEAVNNCWTKRELERQINTQLYERLDYLLNF